MATNLTTSLNIDGTTYDLGDAELRNYGLVSGTSRDNLPSSGSDDSVAFKQGKTVIIRFSGTVAAGSSGMVIMRGLPVSAHTTSVYAVFKNTLNNTTVVVRVLGNASTLSVFEALPSQAYLVGQLVYFTNA